MIRGNNVICKKTKGKFLIPIFRKGKTYKIDKIEIRTVLLYKTPGGGYTTAIVQNPSHIAEIYITNYIINGVEISEELFNELFYNKREERYIKLKYLKDKYENRVNI